MVIKCSFWSKHVSRNKKTNKMQDFGELIILKEEGDIQINNLIHWDYQL